MLAAFIRADGKFGGLHTTFLTGRRYCPTKLEISDPETGELLQRQKKCAAARAAHTSGSPADAKSHGD
jgi:hypothetical protein